MGLDREELRVLSFVHRTGAMDLTTTVTFGRQGALLNATEFKAAHGGHFSDEQLDLLNRGDYIEPFLKALGAETVDSVDASDYEGASIVHDFNLPLPSEWRERFTAYIDFGSIEHVFNAPQVALNVNHLLQVGGTALIVTNANGETGHGFYQYSPEFFFTVFSEANGFSRTEVFLIDRYRRLWYRMKRPGEAGRRSQIPNRRFFVMCLARKTRTVEAITAQQSDYAEVWAETTKASGPLAVPVRRERRFRQKLFHAVRPLEKGRDAWMVWRRFRRQVYLYDPEKEPALIGFELTPAPPPEAVTHKGAKGG